MQESNTKIIIKNNVRIYLSDYQKVTQDILNIHKYTPLSSLILANGITTFGTLGFLYGIDKVAVLMKTNGAMKTFALEFKDGNIRALLGDGTVTTEYDNNKLHNTIPLILGIGDEGVVRVSRFTKNNPYTSEVQIANGDMITDLVYYLNKSDQIFSAILNDVWLNEDNPLEVDRAKSALFQLLPNHTEEDVLWIENIIQNTDFKKTNLTNFIKLIDGKELQEHKIFSKCDCTSKKMLNAINLLSQKEKKEIIKKDEDIEIKCDFCLNSLIIKVESIKI